MRIGDVISWQGRRYVLRGLEPMSVPNRCAELEDEESGECVEVPIAELEDSGD